MGFYFVRDSCVCVRVSIRSQSTFIQIGVVCATLSTIGDSQFYKCLDVFFVFVLSIRCLFLSGLLFHSGYVALFRTITSRMYFNFLLVFLSLSIEQTCIHFGIELSIKTSRNSRCFGVKFYLIFQFSFIFHFVNRLETQRRKTLSLHSHHHHHHFVSLFASSFSTL